MSLGPSSITVNLPFVSGTWELDVVQRKAAWEMYVELITRIAVQPLEADEGLLREALGSLYSLFGETRRILKLYGPDVARRERKQLVSFGMIAVDVLNVWLRPFTAKWHRLLTEHEGLNREHKVSASEHERTWQLATGMRADLEVLRRRLTTYADLLAEACRVPSLHARPEA
jgi:hypothetical protein